MCTQQSPCAREQADSRPKHRPNLSTIIEYWGTSAGSTRTVIVQPNPPLQPRPVFPAVKAVDFGIIERKSTDCGEASHASFSSSKADSVVTAEAEISREVTTEYICPPLATERTSLLSGPNPRRAYLAIPGYGTVHQASQDYVWHPASKPYSFFGQIDDIPTSATLEPGFYLTPTDLTTAADIDFVSPNASDASEYTLSKAIPGLLLD